MLKFTYTNQLDQLTHRTICGLFIIDQESQQTEQDVTCVRCIGTVAYQTKVLADAKSF